MLSKELEMSNWFSPWFTNQSWKRISKQTNSTSCSHEPMKRRCDSELFENYNPSSIFASLWTSFLLIFLAYVSSHIHFSWSQTIHIKFFVSKETSESLLFKQSKGSQEQIKGWKLSYFLSVPSLRLLFMFFVLQGPWYFFDTTKVSVSHAGELHEVRNQSSNITTALSEWWNLWWFL